MSGIIFTEEWLADYRRRMGQGESRPAEDKQPPKRSKYGNKRTELDGQVFDSRHEAQVYEELRLRYLAGELRGILRQMPFLLPGGVRYVADFVILNNDGTYSVLDAKSEATSRDKTYRIKKRQMRECLGIEVQEV